MKGIEKITDRIAQDTQAEIKAKVDQAQAEANKILADYQAQAESLRTKLTEKGERELAESQARVESMVQLEQRKNVLAAKQTVIDEAFEKALAALQNLPEAEMVPLLARMVASMAETKQEEVILSPEQSAAYGQKVVTQANELLGGAQLTLGQPDAKVQGGLILRRGPVDVNGTFDMLVQRQRVVLSGQVAALLFPPEEKP